MTAFILLFKFGYKNEQFQYRPTARHHHCYYDYDDDYQQY